jgi:hypothetical protein
MKNKTMISVAFALSLFTVSGAQADEAISTAEMLVYCEGTDGSGVTCEIYGQAVYDTYRVLVATAELPNIICVKQPAPTRNEVIKEYVTWAKADAQLANVPAAQTMLRFLTQRFPC